MVVVLGIGGAVAYYVFGDSAPAKPKLSSSSCAATGGASPSSSPDGTWHIAKSKNTYVGYRIKELFGGATLKRDAVGRTPDATGTLTIASNQVQKTTVTANVTTLVSNRSPRDQYIHTHALDSDRFPQASFTLSKPIALPASAVAGNAASLQASGSLTLHGTTKPITLTLDTCWRGATIEVAGTAPIVLADYGIDSPHTPIVSVDNHGSLEVHLLFSR
ncbi:MAG: hypothetical protein JWL83_4606 [Actinomycetia bacterium]|nr:hypothetical protein [Actinomycetes bacterium]